MKKSQKQKWKTFFAKTLVSLAMILICGIPIWIILGAKYLLGAEGFWQNLIVFGIGFYFLGFVQLVSGAIGLSAIYVIWFSKKSQQRGPQ